MIEEWEFDDLQTGIVNFTDRDLNILKDLYEYRTLTTQQVLKWYFDKKRYGYQRMYLLRKDGLINSRPLVVEHGRKQTSCYFITDKGIRVLLREGVIERPVRQAKNIQIKGPHLRYVVETNDIYLQLRDYGWTVLGGREVKNEFKLNRADLIQGMLISGDGEKFGIYIVSDNPAEHTASKIVTEIGNSRLPSHIVFCRGKSGYEMVRDRARKMNVFVGGSLNVLPFANGVKILRSLRTKASLVRLYTMFGEVRQVEGGRLPYQYVIRHKGEDKYVAQLLTGDLMTHFSLTKYNRDIYIRDGKKVLVFAWSAQRGEIEQAYRAYPHIEFEWLEMGVLDTLPD
ncbi:replication-relaxation family protein [Novibacillus thermophilus]|uniref:Uncharacterized protein n=1 Tax=Novibacillus thermophilus TaxID=1471761 RepID=A0A1U9K6N9_9BACL|nr:replication-relaxation family protein [Novibacillus thermophilus]AQS55676.1 hypothetical protein B0W44_07625 [Novibacillus thermophilus]